LLGFALAIRRIGFVATAALDYSMFDQVLMLGKVADLANN